MPGPERQLAAVLAADLVGYGRLIEVNETGTLARLKIHWIELIDPAIAKNRGRNIKTRVVKGQYGISIVLTRTVLSD